MIHWATDIGHSIEIDHWQKLWKKDLKFTACYALKQNCLKMVHTWYLTSSRLAKMYKSESMYVRNVKK